MTCWSTSSVRGAPVDERACRSAPNSAERRPGNVSSRASSASSVCSAACPSLTSRNRTSRESLEVPRVAGVVAVELDQRGVAQPGHAVAGLVVGIVAREDAEFRSRLGEEQHDDPVQVAQALAREVARIDLRPRALLPVADVVHDGVGQDLDAAPHPVTQLLRDAGGLGGGAFEQCRRGRSGLRRPG